MGVPLAAASIAAASCGLAAVSVSPLGSVAVVGPAAGSACSWPARFGIVLVGHQPVLGLVGPQPRVVEVLRRQLLVTTRQGPG